MNADNARSILLVDPFIHAFCKTSSLSCYRQCVCI